MAAIVNNVETMLGMKVLGRRPLTVRSNGIQKPSNLRLKMVQMHLILERMMLEHQPHFQSIIKVAIARSQDVSRSTVNAFKQISFAPRIVNARIARILKEARSYGL